MTAISETYPDIAVNHNEKAIINIIGIFYPSGEPISPHRLRCGLFDVHKYAFTGRFLAARAILTRE
jgi:hypothetical protein